MQRSQGMDYPSTFQQKYALHMLDFEQLNKKINENFKGVLQSWREVGGGDGVVLMD